MGLCGRRFLTQSYELVAEEGRSGQSRQRLASGARLRAACVWVALGSGPLHGQGRARPPRSKAPNTRFPEVGGTGLNQAEPSSCCPQGQSPQDSGIWSLCWGTCR